MADGDYERRGSGRVAQDRAVLKKIALEVKKRILEKKESASGASPKIPDEKSSGERE